MLDLDRDFKEKFPKLDFSLKPFQKQVIGNVIENGSTLCIMPTGGGKSAVYWMAAAEIGGITLVVSPLTALISEQAEKLDEQGYETLVIHGGINPVKQMNMLTELANGRLNPAYIFASPEKYATDGYFEHCLKQRKRDIKLLVIDEVHCVSQWGMSFRPFYKRIPDFMDRLFGENEWCRILALTATLNPMELKDICEAFRISRNNILKETILLRSEIQLHTLKFSSEDEKETKFWEIIKTHRDEKTLVYVYRKRGERAVEGLCEKALEKGYKAAWFHGDMTSSERMDIIEKYRKNNINLVFATNAFGMGIDIPDIRNVIHFMIPESAEQYYQEVGRAARDGHGANAYLLYSNKNIDVKRTHFIDRSFPTEDKLREVYKNIGKREGCRVIPYFDNEDIQECLPYYMECGLIKIICKGFAGLKEFYDIADPELQTLYDSSGKAKGFIRAIKTNNISAENLTYKVYDGVMRGKVKLRKPLERWLVIDVKETDISEEQMEVMLADIQAKKEYKHELLNYFVKILEDNRDSQHLHQEIARYLGMDKYQLNRIYTTADGNHVRSKSEVIISDLLYGAGIRYKYEEKLEYEHGKFINPDFTIYLDNDKKMFWEHVGMLGTEEYDVAWSKKTEIYEKFYPGQLIKTYENGALAKDAQQKIEQLRKLYHCGN